MTTIRGGEKATEYLRKMKMAIGDRKSSVKVGFLEGATYPDGTSVALIAAIQNFGAPAKGIPPRPFFSNMVTTKSPTWGPAMAAVLPAVDYNVKVALAQMGELIVGELRQSIIDTNAPPLSPVTLLLRERFWTNPEDITFGDVKAAWRDVAAGVKPNVGGTQAKPLIWTAHMINSVDYEVK